MHGETMDNIGQRVRTLRRERKLSQCELAALVGVRQSAISNIEKGRNRPSFKLLLRLRDALRVAPGDLFPESPPLN